MEKEIVITDKAPAAIGPYSQGVIVNNMLFTSGQLPIDYRTGDMPESIEEQTKLSLTNIKSIVEKTSASMKNIIKVTVFLSDMNNFSKMNEIYQNFFTESYPARSCVEVSRLPKDALVEIEAIAILN